MCIRKRSLCSAEHVRLRNELKEVSARKRKADKALMKVDAEWRWLMTRKFSDGYESEDLSKL